MTVALILATMFFSLIAGFSLFGGSLAQADVPLLYNWGLRLVALVERLILRPALGVVRVQTGPWPVRTKARACLALGIGTAILTVVFGKMASLSGP